MSEQTRVYLAGPIQHSASNGKGWRERIKGDYSGFEWVDPLDKYDGPEIDEGAEWSDERIVDEDKALIDSCDAVLMHYEKVPTWGSPREQEYAVRNNIPVFVQTTESDPSPWLTADAECVESSFLGALIEIDNYFAQS